MIVTPQSLEALDALTERIEAAERLTASEAQARQKAFSKAVWERMAEGRTFAEANGALPHLARPDALEWLKANDNNLMEQVKIVDRALTFWWRHGEIVAPHYPNRICIILRKAKEFEREARFSAAWLAHFGRVPHRRKLTGG